MSTYLVAIIIGDLKEVKYENKNKNLSIWVEKGKEKDAKYALNFTINVVNKLEEYIDINYYLSKLDQVAVPNLDFEGMENWGVITYE